jgi:hypothetical protein
MYSVYQHWDPLKICIVGKSYSPKFYDYIKNKKVRDVFYKIAEENEINIQVLEPIDIDIFWFYYIIVISGKPEKVDSFLHKGYEMGTILQSNDED